MTQQERSRNRWAKWRRLVSQQGQSGESVAGFCRKRGLCASHFFWWKKRLSEGEATRFVAVKLTGEGAPQARESCLGGVEVCLRNGRSLRVARGFDADHVRALLAVLEGEA